jgi:hypothetical protein
MKKDFIIRSTEPTPENLLAPILPGTTRTEALNRSKFDQVTDNAVISTFFSKQDLKALLAQPNSGGLRIYPAFADEAAQTFTMLAVATTDASTRGDIVSDEESNLCLLANGTEPASRVKRLDAFNMMTRLNAHLRENGDNEDLPFSLGVVVSPFQKSYSKVFFSEAKITELLEDENTIGIRFYSVRVAFAGSTRAFPTLMAVAQKDTGEDASTATVSLLPCPPDCGGGSYTDSVAEIK